MHLNSLQWKVPMTKRGHKNLPINSRTFQDSRILYNLLFNVHCGFIEKTMLAFLLIRDNPYITSVHFWIFSDQPTHVNTNKVLNVTKNCNFLQPPTPSVFISDVIYEWSLILHTYQCQFGCGISKTVGPKKEGFWPRINMPTKSFYE